MSSIDVHTHFIPDTYLAALAEKGITEREIGFPMARWDVEERLAVMDGNDIQTEMLSLSSPGLRYWSGPEAARLARVLNDELAGIVRDRPSRFGALATLPLPDVDASLAEIAYALDDLGMDGVAVMTNYDGVFLGDHAFAPVFDELNRRRAVVFVHPTEGPSNDVLTQGYPAPAFEYPAESTRMVVSLIDTDMVARCPDVRIIVSHGGGTLPLIQPRLAVLLPWKRKEDPEEGAYRVNRVIDSLYFDTAIVSYPASLAALRAMHDTSRLLTGYDLPFFPTAKIAEARRNLEAFGGYTAAERAMIDSGNALNLFLRLARVLPG